MDENKLKNNIKSSFSNVSASEDIKNKTKLYLKKKTGDYGQKTRSIYPTMNLAKYTGLVAVCMIMMIFTGYKFYFNTVASISIDINPSLEFGVNCLGRVISVDGYNEDGISLANKLDLKNKDYYEAVLEMLENEKISDLMKKDETLSICIVGKEDKTTSKIVQRLNSLCTEKENIECNFEHRDKMAKAHELGISYGKYRAYLECKKVDESITIEDIKSMTMREIRLHIDSCKNKDSSTKENYNTNTTIKDNNQNTSSNNTITDNCNTSSNYNNTSDCKNTESSGNNENHESHNYHKQNRKHKGHNE